MVQSFEYARTYRYPFPFVAAAYFHKYPCKEEELVLEVHVANQSVDDDGVVHATRAIKTKNPAPAFFHRVSSHLNFLGHQFLFFDEEVDFDPRRQVLTLRTWNRTFHDTFSAYEESEYRPHPERPGEWTQFKQKGTLTCHIKVPFIAPLFEQVANQVLKSGAEKGFEIFEGQLATKYKHAGALKSGLSYLLTPELEQGFAKRFAFKPPNPPTPIAVA